MSCCGNKIQSLNFFPAINQAQLLQEAEVTLSLNNSKKNAETSFRFTGNNFLEVKSLFGNQRYLFTQANPIIAVLAEDSDLMRAYSDLVEMKS